MHEENFPNANEPIAIIGIGCRFPGGADNPISFWQLINEGRDAITEIPKNRFDIDALFSPHPGEAGKIVTKHGGFIENIDQFDAAFFGISPREANSLDPQQRLLLEVCYEAFEDGGQTLENLYRSNTGVFTGLWTSDYENIMYKASPAIDLYMTTGGGHYSSAGRISYVFNLLGPSVSVGTACSSALVAVHMACKSILSGESDLAIAAAVNLILQPSISIAYSHSKILSPDGRCKFGDKSANGYVRGEGCGVVILKKLSLALADNDPIYAAILGSAVNHDGGEGLFVAPNQKSQELLLRQAYRNAGILPGQVDYVEAHGTGTAIGDPTELNALVKVLAEGRSTDSICKVGSVKTNFGHTEAASGMAGLIKAALCLKHRQIPTSLHCKDLNPKIKWAGAPLMIQNQGHGDFPEDKPAIAGVNSFGVSGTNAHIVLKEIPPCKPGTNRRKGYYLMPLSAKKIESLEAKRLAFIDYLGAGENHSLDIRDITYTAGVKRSHHKHRIAISGANKAELIEELTALESHLPKSEAAEAVNERIPKGPVFVFSGQGPQWFAMGQQLFEQEIVYRQTVENISTLIAKHAGWSLVDEMNKDEATTRIGQTEIAQPAIFALQMGIDALWRSWGIEPGAIVGHSIGEVAASCASGVLSLEDAVKVVYHRGRLLQRATGKGRMAAVNISEAKAEEILQKYDGRLTIAAVNSPESITLSGGEDALNMLKNELEGQNIFFRKLAVNYAFHSPVIDDYKDEMVTSVEGILVNKPKTMVLSTVKGTLVDELDFGPQYWASNIRNAVQFGPAITALIESGFRTFLEIGPHPVLSMPMSQCLNYKMAQGNILSSLRRGQNEQKTMFDTLGVLFSLGNKVNWEKLFPESGSCVHLPDYPWQKESYWFSHETIKTDDFNASYQDDAKYWHPILRRCTEISTEPGTFVWNLELGNAYRNIIRDHRIQDVVLMPAALFSELALSGASEVFGKESLLLQGMVFKEALILDDEIEKDVQMVFKPVMPGTAECRFLSCPINTNRSANEWTLHAKGIIQFDEEIRRKEQVKKFIPKQIQDRLSPYPINGGYYQYLSERGYQYGKSFQCLKGIWVNNTEILGKIHLSEDIWQPSGFYLPPSILDGCLQLMVFAAYGQTEDQNYQDMYIPVRFEDLIIFKELENRNEFWSYSSPIMKDVEGTLTICGDIVLFDESGKKVLEIQNLQLEKIGGHKKIRPKNYYYRLSWKANDRKIDPKDEKSKERQRKIIFCDTEGIGKRLADELDCNGQNCILVFPGNNAQKLTESSYRINYRDKMDFQALFSGFLDPDEGLISDVIYLWAIDKNPPNEVGIDDIIEDQKTIFGGGLFLAQAILSVKFKTIPRLWFITRNVHSIGTDNNPLSVGQSTLWGLGRVIALEHPELKCSMLDMGNALLDDDLKQIANEISSNSYENQIAIRSGKRYTARLQNGGFRDSVIRTEMNIPAYRPYRLSFSSRGTLDNLSIEKVKRKRPCKDEVEIQVKATGLNFRDVLNVLNMYPGDPGPLGLECSGEIVATGRDVKAFSVGDEVIAFAQGCFSSFITVPVAFIAKKPERLSYESAATIPVVFMTAYHCLVNLADIKKGDRVLIHAASGGVGMAAVQIAKAAGAEIFGTAGKPEKRNLLKKWGVDHVFNSRTLDFAEEILDVTNGEGVDIVLNSLSGDFIPKSLSVLGSEGRFVEIGKIGIWTQAEVQKVKGDCSYFIVDLVELSVNSPQLINEILNKLVDEFNNERLQAIKTNVFPFQSCIDAFRLMSEGKHVGKVVISQLSESTGKFSSCTENRQSLLRSDSVYLITGGFGGIGLLVAQWMIQNGAQTIMLIGRSTPSSEALEKIATFENMGAEIMRVETDISVSESIRVISERLNELNKPLRGIIHCAGIVDDGVLLRQSWEQFERVMAPKVLGAYNLHNMTREMELDFFILFSSFVSVLGSPGQANYSAANAYMDALAYYRQANQLPAHSINWGPWAEVGMAAASKERGARLESRGVLSIMPDNGLKILEEMIVQDHAQTIVMPIDIKRWRESYPTPYTHKLFEEINGDIDGGKNEQNKKNDIIDLINDTQSFEKKYYLLEKHLKRQVSFILRLPESGIATDIPFKSLGLDSLTAQELRNRLEQTLKMSLPVTMIWNYPTIGELTRHITSKMNIENSETHAQDRNTEPENDIEDLVEELGKLSKDEISRILGDG